MFARKGWKNRHLACGIVTRLLLSLREKCLGVWWSSRLVDYVDQRRAKKISNRWNNVCARRPENVGFRPLHCSTIVPHEGRGGQGAGRSGIGTTVGAGWPGSLAGEVARRGG